MADLVQGLPATGGICSDLGPNHGVAAFVLVEITGQRVLKQLEYIEWALGSRSSAWAL